MARSYAQWGNDLYTGARSYHVVGRRRRWFAGFAIIALLCIVVLLTKGFNPGIEFRGGSQFTVQGVTTTSQQPAIDAVEQVAPEEVPRVSVVGGTAVRVQTSALQDTESDAVRDALAEAYAVSADDVSVSYIGPSWGQDVTQKALTGVVIFLLLVGLVMTMYFRAWRMAAASLIALMCDLVITVGVYALVGWEVTPAGVIGFLTILGYSLYDTVVVFDKIRENTVGLTDQTRSTYGELANLAINQTLVRSINTSVVALLPVGAILFIGALLLGAGTLRDIALALFVGMTAGTFSSILLATPLLVELREREPKIAAHTTKVHRLRAERSAAAGELAGGESGGGEAAVGAAPGTLLPGGHLGQGAQPRRRRGGSPSPRASSKR